MNDLFNLLLDCVNDAEFIDQEVQAWDNIIACFYPLSALVGTRLAYNPHHEITYFRAS